MASDADVHGVLLHPPACLPAASQRSGGWRHRLQDCLGSTLSNALGLGACGAILLGTAWLLTADASIRATRRAVRRLVPRAG
jgi:hypothetical protein